VHYFAVESVAIFVSRVRIPSLAPFSAFFVLSRLAFAATCLIILQMALPTKPIALSIEQIDDLNRKLATLRHDVNNNLSLIMAASEILRRRPETAERMLDTLSEQPQKIAGSIAQFSRELETALGIKRH
jgi:predicted PurR-regulated permease PerM